MKKYIVALDQGTTSSRAIIFDRQQNIVAIAQQEFAQHYPQPGYVEHDAFDIYTSQAVVMQEAILKSGISPEEIAGIGIANQRETTILWDKNTGMPIHNAIVWQCRRTAGICEELKARGLSELVLQKTGLKIDAYFSATKIMWLLDNVKGARQKAENGELLFGTVDTWLIWKLTGGQVHVTDYTNASRTMLFNINTLSWDKELLELFNIPVSILPKATYSSEIYGYYNLQGVDIPIAGIAGDQQAALFGQACFDKGMAKNTYGTGCFLLMNTGSTPCITNTGLLATIGIGLKDKICYAIEGSVFVGGAVIQWLRDEMHFINESRDVEYFATKIPDNGGVYFVPAFTGIGAPYWDMYARGAIYGITRGTKREHICRAALESIAFQTKEVIDAMVDATGIDIEVLRVDGGASRDSFLMQFQADISNITINRPLVSETTALGVAFLAGLATGFWESLDEIKENWTLNNVYKSRMQEEERQKLLEGWRDAIVRTLTLK